MKGIFYRFEYLYLAVFFYVEHVRTIYVLANSKRGHVCLPLERRDGRAKERIPKLIYEVK